MTGKIYILFDPRDNHPKYIGQTIRRLSKRFNEHLDKTKLIPNNNKNAWIKHLLSIGLKPKLELLEEVEFDNFDQFDLIEQMWVGLFRSWGFDMKNDTEGGKQGRHLTKRKKTPEEIERQRQTLLESYKSGKIINAHKGTKQSEERKAKSAHTHIHKVLKPDSIAKRAASHKGKKRNSTQKATLRQAKLKSGNYTSIVRYLGNESKFYLTKTDALEDLNLKSNARGNLTTAIKTGKMRYGYFWRNATNADLLQQAKAFSKN